MPDSKYRFWEQESYDHIIIDANTNKAIGRLRIKPSSILWKPKNQRKFLAIPLDDFTTWISANGKPVNQ